MLQSKGSLGGRGFEMTRRWDCLEGFTRLKISSEASGFRSALFTDPGHQFVCVTSRPKCSMQANPE